MTTARRYGARSSTADLREVLVQRPGPAFGRAFDDPAHGFLRPVDLDRARREHDGLVAALDGLGVQVHQLDADPATDPDLVYVFDPLLVTDAGAIPLRPGKPNRADEPAIMERWLNAHDIPTAGRIEAPGTVEAGDTVWLRDDLFVIGRTLRTNDAGARQLGAIVGGDVRIVDVPYWQGPAELVHLMSVISPVSDELAVVFLPLLPAGLYGWLHELGIRLVEVPEEEYATLGCNVLAVRPGVVIVADGNPVTRRGLEAAGVRGARGRPRRGRREWLGRGDVPDPADPARMSGPATALEAAAAAAVDPAALRAELQAIVRIPSITGHEEAVAADLAERLGAAGMAVETTFPDPAVIRADPAWPGEETEREVLPVIIGRLGRPGGRRVVLSGHIDVVPPGDPATWTADPWGGEVRDGSLYGRGACDMKGGVAAILAAVRALVASGVATQLGGELIVALVPGEEDGGQGTLAAIRAGATGDLAIITEPSNLDIVVAHAGAITFRLTVPGRAAHASQRREGVSALDNLYRRPARPRRRRDRAERRRD